MSELLENRFLTSLELVNTISLVYLFYSVDPKFKNFEIPELLDAFSSDFKLQTHLKAFWESVLTV